MYKELLINQKVISEHEQSNIHIRKNGTIVLCDIPTSSKPEIAAMKNALPNRTAAVWSNKNLYINDRHSTIAGKGNVQRGI